MTLTTIKVRRSTPKVRTGCATCKIRKVKCDETRPKCNRCVSTGRSCPGYPQTSSPPSDIKSYNIPFKVPGSRTDRELLHFYCCEAANSLSRFSETTLWTRIILQRSQSQPVIRHAVVALSCLYRDYMALGSSQLQVSAKHIKLIARSHTQLRTYLIRDASTEVALICSLIFYTFECLVGNIEQAIWHLDQALTLFQRCYPNDINSENEADSTYGQLKAIFTRLDIHACMFSPSRMPVLKLALPGQLSGLMPVVPEEMISDLCELEYAMLVLENWTIWHLLIFLEYKGLPVDQVPLSVLNERLHLEAQFQELEKRMEQLSTSSHVQYTSSQHQQLILLQSETLIFLAVLLENTFQSPDDPNISLEASSRYDRALAQISTLLSSSSDDGQKAAPSKRNFTLSTNLIAMLYYICLKAKNRRVLRAALSLMEGYLFASRDGLWNASKAVAVVKAMISEEFGDNESQEMPVRLEDLGIGIVDANGGLDEAFKMLQIEDKQR